MKWIFQLFEIEDLLYWIPENYDYQIDATTGGSGEQTSPEIIKGFHRK